MIKKLSQKEGRRRRHHRVRKTLAGTAAKPRLNVFRSQKHIYAQLIDDLNAMTLASANSLEKLSLDTSLPSKPFQKAKAVGKLMAQKAVKKGISEVIFDRAGYKFHGRVKALAEGAREGGLKF